MEMNEALIDRWLLRGSKFFKTVARNPVVRATLLARGLTDDELARGWALYTQLHGFGVQAPAQPAAKQTGAAQAINELDAWDAPAFAAARAVLEARYPAASRFLFENLEASVGTAAVAGVEQFLDRVAQLRAGTATGVNADDARAAAELLATRKIIDVAREGELRALIEKARLGARPDEVIPAPAVDPSRSDVADEFVAWLNEWREVARMAIARRDYRISLGLAQRRHGADDGEDAPEPAPAPAQPPPS